MRAYFRTNPPFINPAYGPVTVIGVHEMHGRMHPNYCQITILLVVDNYYVFVCVCMCACVCVHVCTYMHV